MPVAMPVPVLVVLVVIVAFMIMAFMIMAVTGGLPAGPWCGVAA